MSRQIVKSLIFRSVAADEALLVLVSGADRVDESRLARGRRRAGGAGHRQFRAGPHRLRDRWRPTRGPHQTLATYLDEHLLDHALVWAAAGTPRAVFSSGPPTSSESPRPRSWPSLPRCRRPTESGRDPGETAAARAECVHWRAGAGRGRGRLGRPPWQSVRSVRAARDGRSRPTPAATCATRSPLMTPPRPRSAMPPCAETSVSSPPFSARS